MAVFINGRFVEPGEARVSAFDAGVRHAVGLFETMRGGIGPAGGAWVLGLDAHLERLIESARELGLYERLGRDGLRDAVLETVLRTGHREARVRLTVTGGDLQLLGAAAGSPPHRPTVVIDAQPVTAYPDEMFDGGVGVTLAELRVSPTGAHEGHKTPNYWPRLRALQRAAEAGAGEALVFDTIGRLTGGCVSSAILVREGRLLAPYARGERPMAGPDRPGDPVLPGTTRRLVLDWAAREGIAVELADVRIDDVLAADEVVLTNSSWGVLPVVRVEASAIGVGAPGPMARRMRAAWLAALDDQRRRA